MNDDKKGIELIIDRVEAVRVRIASAEDEQSRPRHERGDIAGLYSWKPLLQEALAEATKFRGAWDTITANLALAIDASPEDVAAAVKLCVRDNERKEKELAELRNPATPALRSQDPEIALIQHAIIELKKLEPDAQRRVVDYVIRFVTESNR